MPYNQHGQHFIDLVTQVSPAVPMDLNRPIDVADVVNKLAQATPASRAAFLQRAQARMQPATFRDAVSALGKAAANRTGGSAGAEAPGPAGTYFPTSPIPRRPGPAEPNDPAYATALVASGVRYRSQQYLNDPTKR